MKQTGWGRATSPFHSGEQVLRDRLVGRAVNSVTDILFPASSEQGRKATRIGYTGSFSNAGLAALGTKCVTELAARPTRKLEYENIVYLSQVLGQAARWAS